MSTGFLEGLTEDEFKELMSEMKKVGKKFVKPTKRGVYRQSLEKFDGEIYGLNRMEFLNAVVLIADYATGNYCKGDFRNEVSRARCVNTDIVSEYSEICLSIIKAVSEMQKKLGLNDASKHNNTTLKFNYKGR